MNQVVLMGRLTRNPEYKEVQNERGVHHVATFNFAVKKNFSDGTDFFRVTAFGQQADFTRDYLKQGKRVLISGEIETGSYKDKDTGKTIYTTDIIARRIEFADGKGEELPDAPDDMGDFMNISEEEMSEMPFK
ncbi:single-stranded DNA-binding protein [Streptococcus alactolyticus]|uniref:single-stranded DNA-binding protein n=1 Tax=Streptococcus alactolyticus TaxID=29389 RepID=UPI003F9CBE66